MHVSVNGGGPISWADFISINSFSNEEAATIRAALDEHRVYEGGGGAAAEFTVEIAPEPPAFYTVAIYLIDRAYGGPEEGGWWYDCGTRVDRLDTQGNGNIAAPRIFTDEEEAGRYRDQQQRQLDYLVNKNRRPVSSVLSEGVYAARVCDGYPEPHFPAVRPHYE